MSNVSLISANVRPAFATNSVYTSPKTLPSAAVIKAATFFDECKTSPKSITGRVIGSDLVETVTPSSVCFRTSSEESKNPIGYVVDKIKPILIRHKLILNWTDTENDKNIGIGTQQGAVASIILKAGMWEIQKSEKCAKEIQPLLNFIACKIPNSTPEKICAFLECFARP